MGRKSFLTKAAPTRAISAAFTPASAVLPQVQCSSGTTSARAARAGKANIPITIAGSVTILVAMAIMPSPLVPALGP